MTPCEIDFWTAESCRSPFISGLAEIRWPDGTGVILSGGGVTPKDREQQVMDMVCAKGLPAGTELRVRWWRWPA